jgi:tRNA(Ile)-lysidine synthase TilS/MesJ
MGLDQYLYKVEREEVAYWRKNNQLQAWFEKNCDQQNCVPTQLHKVLVENLLEDIKGRNLPTTRGFFYGTYEMEDEQYDDLQKVFERVLKDIIENDAEYEYDCWY